MEEDLNLFQMEEDQILSSSMKDDPHIFLNGRGPQLLFYLLLIDKAQFQYLEVLWKILILILATTGQVFYNINCMSIFLRCMHSIAWHCQS